MKRTFNEIKELLKNNTDLNVKSLRKNSKSENEITAEDNNELEDFEYVDSIGKKENELADAVEDKMENLRKQI